MESEKTRPLIINDKLLCILFLIAAIIGTILARYAGWLAFAAVVGLIVISRAQKYYEKHDASPKRHLVIYILAVLLLLPAYTLNVNLKLYYPVQKFFHIASYGFTSRYDSFPDYIPMNATGYTQGFYPPINQTRNAAYVGFYTDFDHALDYEAACMIREADSCTMEEYLENYANHLDLFDKEQAAGSMVYVYECADQYCCAHVPNKITIINKETGFVFMQG
ncbi:MAG: hypothetical protein IJ265_08555 [Oscillospiraceae bacterium]|nr:hypothetical protein [Oscillospiraceae bacterium]